MDFNPNNPIVQLCMKGMAMETTGEPEKAIQLFQQAWNEAGNDFEKYLAAWYLSRQQLKIEEKLHWLETVLNLALRVNNPAVDAVFTPLCTAIAEAYEAMQDIEKATLNHQKAASMDNRMTEKGPFYHGTKANLRTGDLLNPGNPSNYQADLTMNHIYFTALPNGAGLAAALAKGDGTEHVYIVEPMGSFEADPNLTNKKFPGNVTRSYRTAAPLKITGEIKDWNSITPAELQQWKDRLSTNKGSIIN